MQGLHRSERRRVGRGYLIYFLRLLRKNQSQRVELDQSSDERQNQLKIQEWGLVWQNQLLIRQENEL